MYKELYIRSLEQRDNFWQEQAEAIDWFVKPQKAIQKNELGTYDWFPDGELNTSYLALDYHVKNGKGSQNAIVYDSPSTNTVKKITYSKLLEETAKCSGMLKSKGVKKGERVIIYMPMIPEAIVAMLACARIGAVHSVVFGGFAAHELSSRINDAQPKIIITATCGIELSKIIPYKPLVDQGIELSTHKPQNVIIVKRSQYSECSMTGGRDFFWHEEMQKAKPAEAVPLKSSDPLYILYTSGTTGKPKGVVRQNGGHAVALKFSMNAIYATNPGDVYWSASDIGWVVGHSYIVYGPLLQGCCTVLYEGKPVKTPDAGAIWRVIEQHQVNTFFTAPTAFRAVKKEDPKAVLKNKYDINSLRNIFLAGERLDPPTYKWLKNIVDVPIIDHWWQTETGWSIAANPMGIEPMTIKNGSATLPMVGYDLEIKNDAGKDLAPGVLGNILIKLPLPPGCFQTLWNNHELYQKSYLDSFPGYYLTGDNGYKDQDGYVFIMGRNDDVINVSGHRLSTGEMEELVGQHEAIAECAVVGIDDEIKGQIPVGFYILKDSTEQSSSEIEQELIQDIRTKIGAVAVFKNALKVKRLPKTRSGKILRKIIRALAQQKEVAIPSTIDDPAIIEEIRAVIEERGLGIYSKE